MTARRAAVAVLLAAVIALLVSACSIPGLSSAGRPATAAPSSSPSAPTTASAAATAVPVVDDLARGSAHRTLSVPGEQFDVTIDYWSTTPVTDWTLLTARTLHLSAHVVPHAGSTPQTVAVARATVATALLGGTGPLAGLVTETWTDDAPVTGDLPGYLVSAAYPYEAAVDLAGTTDTLLDRWRAVGDRGEPTVPTLAAAGVTGYRLLVSFRVEVRNPGDAGFHVREVADVLTLPLSGDATTRR